ncbi:MAG: polyisoprenoid-binding protein [Alphaproteobacteria bacterium]|nr:polyisoprenoid-binding protein [Alphaproteobacteria bacterium]
MRRILMTGALCALMFTPSLAHAQIENYTFDKEHTQIFFTVNHLGFSNSTGSFQTFDGGFTFDRGEPQKSKVELTIPTDSLEMNDDKWNEHLKGKDFFNVTAFPTMTFKSTKIDVTGENTANITGDLTLLGVTHPVTLAATLNKADKHPFGDKYMAGFSATASLKRSEFGMDYGLPMVGDDVKIHIEVEGIREDTGNAGTANK